MTPHFQAAEFFCKHCGAHGAKQELAEALEKLRALIGKPIHINSGYRCPKHPMEARKKVPGKHSEGIAADIRVSGFTPRRLYEIAQQVPEFRGFGVDDGGGYLHVDLREVPARWCYRNGFDVAWFDA